MTLSKESQKRQYICEARKQVFDNDGINQENENIGVYEQYMIFGKAMLHGDT